MLVDTKELQVVCKKILDAIDLNSTDDVSEVVEIKASNGLLVLSVTNTL